jgi:hypothetical protein
MNTTLIGQNATKRLCQAAKKLIERSINTPWQTVEHTTPCARCRSQAEWRHFPPTKRIAHG